MDLTHLLKEINLNYIHRARPNFMLYSRDTCKTKRFRGLNEMGKNILGKWK